MAVNGQEEWRIMDSDKAGSLTLEGCVKGQPSLDDHARKQANSAASPHHRKRVVRMPPSESCEPKWGGG